MLEQRLQQRLRLLAIPAFTLVGILALTALLSSRMHGVQPRETFFDLFLQAAPAPLEQAETIALIDIDQASLDNLGPWPWPRTAIARLVAAAERAGARSVTVALPLEGRDPLSPDNLAAFLPRNEENGDTIRQLQAMPTTDAALGAAARALPTAVSAGAGARSWIGWQRADFEGTPWLRAIDNDGRSGLALPIAPLSAGIERALTDTSAPVVGTWLKDSDGQVRRLPLLWATAQGPMPATALAPFALSGGVAVDLAATRRETGAPPPTALTVGGANKILLGPKVDLRYWPGRTDTLDTVPAWRVLEGGAQWSTMLRDRDVFIGESVTSDGVAQTPWGEISFAHLHAHMARQIVAGDVPIRPVVSGVTEFVLTLLAGAITIAAAIFARPLAAIIVSVVVALLSVVVFLWIFSETGRLFDPSFIIGAALGAPLVIFIVVVGNILMRDDALRGAFHGNLPPATMERLQKSTSGPLLNGVRREVVVLSCGFRLPEGLEAKFHARPDDFVRFCGAANDALRRTILSHGGTVDFAENGRLMGYWNVPEVLPHPIEKACACALAMIDEMNNLTENVQTAAFAAGGLLSDTEMSFADASVEVGIAVGECFAGPIGLGTRNRYGVVGPAVTIARQLRSRSGFYGPAIVTDDRIFEALRHHYAFLDLDVLRFSEDDTAHTIYGLVGNPFLKASKAFRELADVQREMVGAWRLGEYAKTTIHLQRLRGFPGVPDGYVERFDARLAQARGQRRSLDRGDHIECLKA